MTHQNEERRPAGNQAATQSLIEDTDILSRARRHDHALLVVAERADRVITTQVFMSLEAAERKVARTRERGLAASLHLVRVSVVPFVTADDLDVLRELGGER